MTHKATYKRGYIQTGKAMQRYQVTTILHLYMGESAQTLAVKGFIIILGAKFKRKKRGHFDHQIALNIILRIGVIRALMKSTKIFDPQTGEVHHSKISQFPPVFDEEKGYLFWNRRSFAKTYQDIEFPKQMTDLEIGRMTRLAKKIWSNTNMLGYRGNGGIRPYDVQMIAEFLGIKLRRAQQFLKKMITIGIIAKVDIEVADRQETHFYVNPIYFFSSNRMPLNLYLLFRDELNEHLPKWVISRFNEEAEKLKRTGQK